MSLVIILIVECGLLAVVAGVGCTSFFNCGSKPSQNWIFSIAQQNHHLCIASYAMVTVGGSEEAMLVTSGGCSAKIRRTAVEGVTVTAQSRDDTIELDTQRSIRLGEGLTGFRLNRAPEKAKAITLYTEAMDPGRWGTTENWKNGERVSSTRVQVVNPQNCHIQPDDVTTYFCVEKGAGKKFEAWHGSPFYVDDKGTPRLAGVRKFDDVHTDNTRLQYHTYVRVNTL